MARLILRNWLSPFWPGLLLPAACLGLTACGSETDAGPGGEDAAMALPFDLQFRLKVSNDVAESIFVQTRDGRRQQQTWVKVYEAGAELLLEPPCGEPLCEGDRAPCPTEGPLVRDITRGEHFGEISLAWDGTVWRQGADGCVEALPIPAGTYEAEFCFASKTEPEVSGLKGDQAAVLVSPACHTRSFVVPPPEGSGPEIDYMILGG